MRTKLVCDSAGQITVKNIMMGVNNNIDDIRALKAKDMLIDGEILALGAGITDNSARIVVLENNTPADAGDLADLTARVGGNETDIASLDSRVSMSATKIATNSMDISTLKTDVMQNKTDIGVNKMDVSGIKTEIMSMGPDIQSNTDDVADIYTRLLAVEMGTNDKIKSLLMQHKVPGGTGGGSAVDMTWTARPLGTAIVNDINATVGPTSITLIKGKYAIRAIAMAEGENQSRLNFGGGMLYGTTLSASGSSEMQGTVDLQSATNISVETIVKTASGMDTFGKASPFTEESVFLTMEIIKVG